MGAVDLSELGFDGLISREWLAAAGNGAYASSTLAGVNTRKYHGLLVAAMSPPVRRMVLLSRVEETVQCGGKSFDLAANEYPGTVHPQGFRLLRAFNAEPFPRWGYQGDGWTLEKQVRLLAGHNTVIVSYSLLGGNTSIDLEVRPLFALRGIHELTYQWNGRLDTKTEKTKKKQHKIPATNRTPEVFFAHDGTFMPQACWYLNTIYRREQERGYSGLEDLWMAGAVKWRLAPGNTVHFVCSTEPIDLISTLREADRQVRQAVPAALGGGDDATLAALVRAADQFVVQTKEKLTAVISAYAWLGPRGRDALIAMPGLLLVTGRLDEAKSLLARFAGLVRNGLMPSELAEDGSGYRYQGADVSLWFINALHEYLRYRDDESFARDMLPVVNQIIDSYHHGTDLGIGADDEGLLRTAAPGIPTTWMDAKLGDWVITPRPGRAVEINALWYNALRIAGALNQRFGPSRRAGELESAADAVKTAFNGRFWNAQQNCCFDVLEDKGFDASIRPNQLFSITLPYPVLETSRHEAVLQKLKEELLTPFGVRTLSPKDANYQAKYTGPPIARDRAYHQGSAFPWLLGPFVTAHLKVHGRGDAARREAKSFLQGCFDYLAQDGLGQVSELFDGDAPHSPAGAIASARSVAELLRCYAEDILQLTPGAVATRPKIEVMPLVDRDPLKT